jgi:hypothetical protein
LIAELEAHFTRQRTGEGKAAKRARGGFAGGGVPMGWSKIGQGREAYLVEDQREQAMLKEAGDLREAGKTFAGIAAELNARGYCNRAGKPIILSQACWRVGYLRRGSNCDGRAAAAGLDA